MSRGLRLIPILLLLVILSGLVWRLVKPPSPAVPSQMVERTVPKFELAAALPAKPRLLNIFASWCVPCLGESPVLAELKRRGVKIDAIAVRDTPIAVAGFLANNGDPYERLGIDPQSDVQISLGSSGVPETFVIDGKGVIRRQYIGALTAANIPGVIQELKEVR